MCRNRVIQLRVTKKQYEMILNKKENLGYVSLSQFVRDLLLKNDLATFRMISEIHDKIMGNKNEAKKKNFK